MMFMIIKRVIEINYRQLGLQRYVIEEVKEGKTPEITNDEKVDLDYITNYWDNIITEIEKEIKKKPNIKGCTFKLNIAIEGEI